ncbi:hypothetical protein [Pantanalinema sp. GBBB05]|uniref:hypothetical protein n=1 Tax=Pantanalinema sp. GBBB05 TaxID=2604139 RepID=UPI003D81ADD4
MPFQVRANAEILNPFVTSLSQILGCTRSCLIHTLIQQRRNLRMLPQLFELSGFLLKEVECLLAAIGS